MDRQQLNATVAIVSWCTFLTALGSVLEDRRREREEMRRAELAAAAQAGAIAATIINALVADADLEPADCSDVLVDHEDCPEECCDTAIRPSAVQ